MKKNILFAVIIVVIIAAFLIKKTPKIDGSIPPSEQVVCTMEAKLCPDGSSVGRAGPDCAFAPCPELANQGETGSAINQLDTIETGGLIFSYPPALPTSYITPQERPPALTIQQTLMTCMIPVRSIGSDANGRNNSYCVETSSEGAAGSVFTHYTYTKNYPDLGKSVSLDLTLRAVQCANYDDPEKTACEQERAAFDLDSIIDALFDSVKFN